MKLYRMFLVIMVLAVLFISCEKPTEVEKMGTLNFRVTVWNAEQDNKKSQLVTKSTIHTVDLINIRHYIPEIEITTDEIYEGISAESITWITMYESTKEMLHTEREVTIQLPPGDYKGLKITQRNRIGWVIEYQGNPIDAWVNQNPQLGDDDLFINYFGANGLFDIEDGEFVSSVPGEKLGNFEIIEGQTTNLVMRLNFTTVDWHDNDDSGDWSNGDEIENHQLANGTDTMVDFIVTYE